MGRRMSAVEAFANARWWAAQKSEPISEDDVKYLQALSVEARKGSKFV